MSDPEFVGYIPEPDVHDGIILRVQHDNATARVLVKVYDGHLYAFNFEGVKYLHNIKAEGMMLYSLTEMTAVPPLRRFVFTNWDHESDAILDLVALDFTSREIAEEGEF